MCYLKNKDTNNILLPIVFRETWNYPIAHDL